MLWNSSGLSINIYFYLMICNSDDYYWNFIKFKAIYGFVRVSLIFWCQCRTYGLSNGWSSQRHDINHWDMPTSQSLSTWSNCPQTPLKFEIYPCLTQRVMHRDVNCTVYVGCNMGHIMGDFVSYCTCHRCSVQRYRFEPQVWLKLHGMPYRNTVGTIG